MGRQRAGTGVRENHRTGQRAGTRAAIPHSRRHAKTFRGTAIPGGKEGGDPPSQRVWGERVVQSCTVQYSHPSFRKRSGKRKYAGMPAYSTITVQMAFWTTGCPAGGTRWKVIFAGVAVLVTPRNTK